MSTASLQVRRRGCRRHLTEPADGDTEVVDKDYVERTSNGLSLIVDAHHDMFVRVGMSVDVAGVVPDTVWASTDYHKVKAGSLLSVDVRQRVKMLGQAQAGPGSSR